MTRENPCPCVNLNCPNHNDCARCNSRHLKKGTLNYCGFYAVLPVLKEAIDSGSTEPIEKMVASQLAAYQKLMEQHGLTPEHQAALREKKAGFSPH